MEHGEIVVMVEQELEKMESDQNVHHLTAADVVERIRRKLPDLDIGRAQKVAARVCKRRYNDYTDEELEAQRDARDEAIKRHFEFLLQTEGPEAADAYMQQELTKYHQESKQCLVEALLLGKAAELLKKFHVNTMSEWPRQAWEEWTEFGVGLGYRRDQMIMRWPHRFRGVQ